MDFGYYSYDRSFGTSSPKGSDEDSAAAASPFVGDPINSTTLQLSVRRARGLRDLRKKMLGSDCFSGPAWDILLHLFESYVLQRRDTIGNVCDGAGLPATTAIRWLYRLEENGMISISNDHLDNRRRFVELSPAGSEAMTRYFAGIAPHLLAA
jgi:DNA-binding MarR family transcriptional regulator